MNAYADMLFTTLLGWVRGLTQSLWSFFASGGSGGFFSWIGDHCLAVTVILCLAGTAADLVVRLGSRRDGGIAGLLFGGWMSRDDRERFDRGYDDGVALQALTPEGEGHIPLFESNLPDASAPSDALFAELERLKDRDEEGAEEPAGQPEDTGTGPVGRRRRGDRHESREKKRLFKRMPLIVGDEDEVMVDSLPAQVDMKDAFHDPVYPNKRNP